MGQISPSAFCQQLKDLTQINATHQEIIDAWNEMLLNFPVIRKKLLLRLKDTFHTSLLSNTNAIHIQRFNQIIRDDIEENSLAPLFHSHYFSNEIGLRKPHRAVFEYVLKENNYNPSETLFLDDSIQHIKGAEDCGIQTYHVQKKPVEELFADFLA